MTTLARRLSDRMSAVTERLDLDARSGVILGNALAASVALGFYATGTVLGGVDPGAGIGFWLGVAAAAALLVVMAYSVRRGLARVRAFGRTNTYLRLHLWSGGLFLLLFLLHTDFGVPAGVFTTLLWLAAVWTVATGAAGIMLQRWIPRFLRRATSFEIHLRRIPDLTAELRSRADDLAAGVEPRVRSFYEREMAPDLEAPRILGLGLLGGSGGPASGAPAETLRSTLSESDAGAFDELCEIHATKREMDVHFTLQKLLRGWLYLHLPSGVLLLGLVALHVFFVTYF